MARSPTTSSTRRRGASPERCSADNDDLNQTRVAFLVPPSFAYAAVQRGIWRAGGVAVPLAVSHPPAELEYVIRDSGASVVVGDPASAADAGAAGARRRARDS